MYSAFLYFSFVCINVAHQGSTQSLPLFISTWDHGANCSKIAYDLYASAYWYSLLDSVELGISYACELSYCSEGVGPYGKVNEDGYITQDAMLMDGTTMTIGSVAALYNVRNAISVARAVMDHSSHTLLVGRDATRFAVAMGFKEEELRTAETNATWEAWKDGNCQPNFWQDVSPNPLFNCGPYTPNNQSEYAGNRSNDTDYIDHDTVNTIGIDENGSHVVVGTSTNGLAFKIPGRVGDSPLAGSGSYADSEVGAAAATGNGDILMRMLPSYQTVENMRQGMSPTDAARDAILRLKKHYPFFSGALIAANTAGEYGAACNGYETFPFSVKTGEHEDVQIYEVICE